METGTRCRVDDGWIRGRLVPGARAECRARLRDELLGTLALRKRRHGGRVAPVVSATGGAFSPGATARGEVVGPGRGRAEASCDVAERIGSLGRARRSAADETEVLRGEAQRRA